MSTRTCQLCNHAHEPWIHYCPRCGHLLVSPAQVVDAVLDVGPLEHEPAAVPVGLHHLEPQERRWVTHEIEELDLRFHDFGDEVWVEPSDRLVAQGIIDGVLAARS